MKLGRFLLACALALCHPWITGAQTPSAAAPRADDAHAARRAADRRALEVLEEVVGESRTLRLPENRAWLLANAAFLLWGEDEGRARRLFQEALASLDDLAGGTGGDGPRDDGQERLYGEVREDVLRLLARRDLPLARDSLRRAARGPRTDEREGELQLALQAAASNPRQAAHLAEQSLSKKVSYQLPELIARLQETDPAAASSLVAGIISKLRSEDLAADEEAAAVACDLLRMGGLPGATASGTASRQSPSAVGPQELKELVEIVSAAALHASPDNPALLLALRPALGEVERYAPALAPRIRRRVADFTQASDEQGRDAYATPAGSGDAAAEDAARPHTSEASARELIKQATESAARGEKERALQLLDEAGRSVDIDSPAENCARLDAQLDVARAYLSVEPGRGLAIVERVVDQLDRLADAAVVIDGFASYAGTPLARSDELIVQNLARLLDKQEYAESLALFADADFARALQAAGRFRRTEVRILAKLLIARTLLLESN